MARTKNSLKRGNNSGSVYLYRGKYALQYNDPLTGKRRIKSLTMSVDGLKRPITTRTDAEAAAVLFLKDINKISEIQHKEEAIFQIAQQKKLIRSLTLNLDEAWDKFRHSPARRDAGDATLKGYETIWKMFHRFLRSKQPTLTSLAEIDPALAETYFTHIWNTGISEQTYNNHLQVLTLIFRTLLGSDFHTENPFAGIRKKTRNTQKREALNIGQLRTVFELLAPENPYHLMYKDEMRLLIKLMTYTGCRGEDAALMEWKNIRFLPDGRNTIVYTPEKTRRKNPNPVCVPIHSDLLDELEIARKNCQPQEKLLLPQVHDRYRRNPSGISKDIMKLLEAAGLQTREEPDGHVRRQTYTRPVLDANGKPVCDRRGRPKTELLKKKICRYSMHSFRHTFVSLAADAGIPLEVVRAIVGHASEDMTRHYLHVSDARKDSAVEALPVFSEAARTIDVTATVIRDRAAMLAELNAVTAAMSDDALAGLLEAVKRKNQ